MITDSALLNDPQRIAEVLDSDGDLDRLGIKPNRGPSAEPEVTTKAAWERTYTVPSQRFPRGRKPADPYQYIASVDECADNDDSDDDAGWIKNRYSYCQRHLIVIPAVVCGIWPPGCYLRGMFISRNTLIGYAKIGGWEGGYYFRWADFDLDVDVVLSSGLFNSAGATMRVFHPA